jgi:hypothetical protein
MIWTVVWHPDATDRPAEIWLEATDRNAVTRATHGIDRAIRENPETKGIDFYGDRLYDEAPLSVVYRMSESDRLVTVLDVIYHAT